MVTQMSEPWGLMRGCDILKSKTRRLSLFLLPQTSSVSLQLRWSSYIAERRKGRGVFIANNICSYKTGKGKERGTHLTENVSDNPLGACHFYTAV